VVVRTSGAAFAGNGSYASSLAAAHVLSMPEMEWLKGAATILHGLAAMSTQASHANQMPETLKEWR
jgi:hypothetical protein